MIPVSHNHAGYPAGIPGTALLDRMRTQAAEYGTRIIDRKVSAIAKSLVGFAIDAGSTFEARAVLLATGVSNNRPAMDTDMHDAALASGRLRYCPICDGYEVTDRRVAVIGTGAHGTQEAIFLRSYTRDLTLIAATGAHQLDAVQRAELAIAGIAVVDGPAMDYALVEDGICLSTALGRQTFDSVYPALGTAVHSGLAKSLGAKTTHSGSVIVDAHQRTSVAGLYAAGDVVLGLDQISHAMGEGGAAATTIRNDLAAISPLRR
jgi:thioredoxin reductase (NADPH)